MSTTITVEDYFGGCPTCGKNDGYLNAGKTHVFYCREHKVSWVFGANVFGSWKDETEDEQPEKYKAIEGFERVAAGLEPARGKGKRLLEQIVCECATTSGCLKRELSGERDGDGYWHGSDPVSASIEGLISVCQAWLAREKTVRNAQRVLEENESEEVDILGDLPF